MLTSKGLKWGQNRASRGPGAQAAAGPAGQDEDQARLYARTEGIPAESEPGQGAQPRPGRTGPGPRFVVVGYFTEGTGYEAEARKLQESADRFGLEYFIEGVPNLGSWQRNTQFKARFLLAMLDDERVAGRPIVYVDADAAFHAYPELFDRLEVDAAFGYLDHAQFSRSRPGKELISSTVYFANNAAARAIVRAWIVENERNPAKWDQKNLQAVVDRTKGAFTMVELPPTYFKIFDIMRDAGPPVIEQYQKSRILKRQIDAR